MSALPAPVSLDTIRHALSFIPAHERDIWYRIGMAIKSDQGEAGFDVWDQWSQTAENYKDADAKAVWRSFKSDGITIGTLLHEAKQRGFQVKGEVLRIDPAELARHRKERSEAIEREREVDAERHEAAANRAKEILDAAKSELATHAYVMRKKGVDLGQRARRGAWPQRGWDDAILLPIYTVNGEGEAHLSSIEAIPAEEGAAKDSLKDGRKSGGIFPIGTITGAARVIIAEGAATAAACHGATGIPVAAALSAGNMKAAAGTVQRLAPNAEIIFAADFDVNSDGSNPGLKAAHAAAKETGSRIAVAHLDGRACDFWDVWNEKGATELKQAIAAAKPVADRAEETPLRHTLPVVWLCDAQMPDYGPAIIKGLLERGALALIYGESGSGKTFFTQDMFAHVACGLPWRGRKVQPGAVAYVAVEAGRAILKRFVAWRDRKLGESVGAPPLAIFTAGPNLLDGVAVAALLQQLRALAQEAACPLASVIFDTLSRSIPGGDENHSEDMTRLIEVANQVRDELGAATVLVHHTGKDPTKGARGHSSLFAAADVVIQVTKGCAEVEKLRDGMGGEKFPFALDVVELGTDEDGDPITTCIVNHLDAVPANPRKDREERLSGVGRTALEALREAISDLGETLPASSTIPRGVRGATLEQWRSRFALRYGSDGGEQRAGETVRKAFMRGREALLKGGMVGISDPYVWMK